ncbi:FHA domain-containing protein [Anaeromyxobacter oryzae]|uniref:FHA domain-containing protein n=1 Tax=Anaeromyxobacter oryzae TaxID=2918170 RepID=A0ABN6MN96_9BACT|nr:FHA domain-containing protein [Anaeromyxobacter oryzae]BDG01831.1 hypothetical protein AMOR_08270 [Anaeromyxobacter oryzae]
MTTAPPTCAACGTQLHPGFRFCGHCGAPAGAPPPPTPQHIPGPTAAPGAATVPARAGCPRLTIVRGDLLPAPAFDLSGEETLCGRTTGSIRLAEDPTVSPRHARFTVRGGALTVEDLGTVNGTFLRIRGPHRLAPGDTLRVGRQVLRLELLPPPAAADASGVRAWGTPGPGTRLRLAQLLEGGGDGDAFPLHEGENAIGREAGDVVFPADRYVSARHALLEVRGESVTVVDVGSSNGTFASLSGETALAPGDQLLVGGQVLRVDA